MTDYLQPTDISIYIGHSLQIQTFLGKKELLGLKGNKAIVEIGRFFIHYINLTQVKPFVRPLDQLTKKIKHNDVCFVPFNILKAYNYIGYHFNVEEEQLKYIIENDQLDMGKMPYWMVNLCAGWHFDIRNLLNKQLANELI